MNIAVFLFGPNHSYYLIEENNQTTPNVKTKCHPEKLTLITLLERTYAKYQNRRSMENIFVLVEKPPVVVTQFKFHLTQQKPN